MSNLNVIVIAIDTLRADHLGCYGYGRETSPNIDAFAGASVVGEWHIAPAIPTHPSFVTINTGQYSITHGIVAHGGGRDIPRTAPWLPQVLHQQGYTTCAVDNLSQWRLDFHRGYEFYIDPTQRRALSLNADNREINRRLLPWLEHHCSERFFCFVHYWDPHTPYLPPRAYRKLFYTGDPNDPKHANLAGMEKHRLGKVWRETWFNKLGPHITDAEYIVSLYDAEIRYCDEGIGQLLRTVEALGLRENTVIILLSDHGEMMYRHGIFFDHHGLYDGNLRVPFLVRHPEYAPRRLPMMTAQVDVAPTIAEICGITVPQEMEGKSLVPWLRGDRQDAVRESIVCQECTWQMKWALRTPEYKFILARQPDVYGTPLRELYDLRSDPRELVNMVERCPEIARTMEQQLEEWIEEKMRRNGLTKDPLLAHGLTLGKEEPA
ncbi:MAG TPA: sulfatase [Candidatus Hydrogenedentes bacterium]|nr:sulfatase [Candidatus Hydrogenedentota bacterium]